MKTRWNPQTTPFPKREPLSLSFFPSFPFEKEKKKRKKKKSSPKKKEGRSRSNDSLLSTAIDEETRASSKGSMRFS
jgi:hypothetical protein